MKRIHATLAAIFLSVSDIDGQKKNMVRNPLAMGSTDVDARRLVRLAHHGERLPAARLPVREARGDAGPRWEL